MSNKTKKRGPGRPRLTTPSVRDRQLLRLYDNGWSQVDLAEKFNISHQRVHQILVKWAEWQA